MAACKSKCTSFIVSLFFFSVSSDCNLGLDLLKFCEIRCKRNISGPRFYADEIESISLQFHVCVGNY